jgi:hypothetical protein
MWRQVTKLSFFRLSSNNDSNKEIRNAVFRAGELAAISDRNIYTCATDLHVRSRTLLILYLSNVSSMNTILRQSDGHNIIKKSKYLYFLPTTHSPTVLFYVNSVPHSTPFHQQAWMPAIKIWKQIRISFELVFLHYTRILTDKKYSQI